MSGGQQQRVVLARAVRRGERSDAAQFIPKSGFIFVNTRIAALG